MAPGEERAPGRPSRVLECAGQTARRVGAVGTRPVEGTSIIIADNPNWRRHKGACVHYRERWSATLEQGDEGCRLLYQIVCLMDTPPLTSEEQNRCLCATRGCWRAAEEARHAPERVAV